MRISDGTLVSVEGQVALLSQIRTSESCNRMRKRNLESECLHASDGSPVLGYLALFMATRGRSRFLELFRAALKEDL